MACFTLEGPDGIRVVPENTPYRLAPGEHIVEGKISWDCGPVAQEGDKLKQLIAELDASLSGSAGDWIKVFAKPVAKALGKASCMSCEVRKVIGNAYGDLAMIHGKLKAMRIIIELVQKSVTTPEIDVLVELNKCLKLERTGISTTPRSS